MTKGEDMSGQILRDGVEVNRRWAEYFEHVLNGARDMVMGVECMRY